MKIPKQILELIEFAHSGRADRTQDTAYPRVRALPKPCEDCDKIVTNRIVRMSVNRNQALDSHIKHLCSACKLYKNPETDAYDFTLKNINQYYKLKNNKDDK